MYSVVYFVLLFYVYFVVFFFFFKQKTAYEMRISDWSSDVCSSDLAALHLDLQGMPVIRRLAVRADDLGALVGVVHGDTVAQRAQSPGDEGGEGGIAALPFEVADHHVGARGAGAVRGDGGADRLHGVDVDVPDRAMARVQGVERLLQLLPIGPPAALDTGAEARHRERPGQQRPAVVGAVAEQADRSEEHKLNSSH